MVIHKWEIVVAMGLSMAPIYYNYIATEVYFPFAPFYRLIIYFYKILINCIESCDSPNINDNNTNIGL